MKPLITDEQRLVSATGRFGHAIKVYDDGFGPLWIHRDSMGISGIVRAQTWEEAYSICEDEFFPACDLTMEEIVKEYNHTRYHVQEFSPDGKFLCWTTKEVPAAEGESVWMDNELFQDAYGFRGNGRKEADGTVSHIYSKDLNGDALKCLTPELVAALEITLQIENNE